MKPKKKNKFFTFMFSLLPGAGEMYMGFMKAGLSLMCLFLGLIVIIGTLNIPGLTFFLALIWFYAFFHTHNLRGLSDAEFEMVEDNYLFGLDFSTLEKKDAGKYRNWFAYILIGLGVWLLWSLVISILGTLDLPDGVDVFIYTIMYGGPRLAVGVLVLWVGIRMIKGKKEILFSEELGEMMVESQQDMAPAKQDTVPVNEDEVTIQNDIAAVAEDGGDSYKA